MCSQALSRSHLELQSRLMRALFGARTPKEAAVIRTAFLFVIQTAEPITVPIVAVFDADEAPLTIAVASDVA
jgi:hypothetical protein